MPTEAPTTVEPEIRERTELAPQWKVLLLDDDVTTIEFVTWLLVTLFHKPEPEARELTWEIHRTGSALATVTSLERAELYVEQVRSLARPRGFPLAAEIEPA
jgi:ATP-dependent Clp protease adaptor protein ClpS